MRAFKQTVLIHFYYPTNALNDTKLKG